MIDRLCEWCKKPFEHDERAVKYCSFLCRDYAAGFKLAQEWAQKEKSPEDTKKMEKARRKSREKLDNIVKYKPLLTRSMCTNEKGKIEYDPI